MTCAHRKSPRPVRTEIVRNPAANGWRHTGRAVNGAVVRVRRDRVGVRAYPFETSRVGIVQQHCTNGENNNYHGRNGDTGWSTILSCVNTNASARARVCVSLARGERVERGPGRKTSSTFRTVGLDVFYAFYSHIIRPRRPSFPHGDHGSRWRVFVRDLVDRDGNSTTANAAYHGSRRISFPPWQCCRPSSPPFLITPNRSTFTGYSTFVYLCDRYSLRLSTVCARRAFSYPSTFARQ